MAKPPSLGSMPVMRCCLLVQAAGPHRRRSMSRRGRSGGTRPWRRFQERSQRASSAASPLIQLFLSGSAGAARVPGVCWGQGLWGGGPQGGP